MNIISILVTLVLGLTCYAHVDPSALRANIDIPTSFVHLFEWKYDDIGDECERFLAPVGYKAVQVSPVQENAVCDGRPWWERYQPISYGLDTRSGNITQFARMIERCAAVGIGIYVDMVFNHVTGKIGKVIGTGGSVADTSTLDFPAIPFNASHFHTRCPIKDYNNPFEVRNCELVGLPDLNQSIPMVREKIIEFMNHLLELGVAGFRVDAAKHMWPADLEVIYGRLNNLTTKYFPAGKRAYIYQEVIDQGNEAIKKQEYTYLGAVTEFKFSHEIGYTFQGENQLKWLQSWGPAWNMVPSHDAFVFVDNHDNQRSNDRAILTYKSRQRYTMAVAFMLGHTYGTPRVMSSFAFEAFDQGPPMDERQELISPAFDSVTGQCTNGWVCEHRWPAIQNMIRFRNVVRNAPVTSWWDNNRNQIAFCRGTRGFMAFNNEYYDLDAELFTCMPSGVYCDVITGGVVDNKCVGTQVTVDDNGEARIHVAKNVGVLAIHIGARIGIQPDVILQF